LKRGAARAATFCEAPRLLEEKDARHDDLVTGILLLVDEFMAARTALAVTDP
jgi:hypothetical protein